MPRKIYVINWDKREIKKGTGTISKGNVGFYQTRKQIPFLHPHSGAAYAKVASVGREGDVENRPTKHLGLKPLVDILAVPCGARGESEGWPESLLRRTNAISSVGCSPQVSPDTLAVSLVGIPETRAPTGVARKIATWIPPCGWWEETQRTNLRRHQYQSAMRAGAQRPQRCPRHRRQQSDCRSPRRLRLSPGRGCSSASVFKVEQRSDWLRVRMKSRSNHSTG